MCIPVWHAICIAISVHVTDGHTIHVWYEISDSHAIPISHSVANCVWDTFADNVSIVYGLSIWISLWGWRNTSMSHRCILPRRFSDCNRLPGRHV